MPEEGKNILKFENFKKQMKAPFFIYADFEAVITKIPEDKREKTRCTEKTNVHEACGFAFTVVRSDGKVVRPVYTYRQKPGSEQKTAEAFLNMLLEVEEELRESLESQEKVKMSQQDWQHFYHTKNCHICDEPLVREQFLDSRQTFDIWTGKYAGQSHKRCFFKEQQTIIPVFNKFGQYEDKYCI